MKQHTTKLEDVLEYEKTLHGVDRFAQGPGEKKEKEKEKGSFFGVEFRAAMVDQ